MSAESDNGAGLGAAHPAKLGKGLALVSTILVVLVAGIAIGNAVRKRADRWLHGYR